MKHLKTTIKLICVNAFKKIGNDELNRSCFIIFTRSQLKKKNIMIFNNYRNQQEQKKYQYK